MPDRLDVAALRLVVPAEPLTAAAFAPFGDVIENPRPDVHPSQFASAFGSLSPAAAAQIHNPVSANQGSATKYQRVSGLADRYASGHSPSGKSSEPLASMFVCAARTLSRDPAGPSGSGLFSVTILERHPYTTQTFVPLSTQSAADTRYLVIVAPNLTGEPPAGMSTTNPPDVRGLRAFVARGDQAVTYGAATWHAPMAALGTAGTALPFFVFQFANGVGPEDCQEVVLDSGRGSADETSAVVVRVPPKPASPPSTAPSSGLWPKL
ncbi:hypothetical protein SCUCBS95973_005204 [Sporothrix curviconia]|uniref:Ureidoglycolate hydrolase n=1 Tax=Sporothrix curviconia TaxID=1260050 RepID=A0ABP0BVA6_9PEZI